MSPARKSASKKKPTKKSTARKKPAAKKKAPAKKKTAAKKSTAKKAGAKKATAKKSTAKKATAKKATAKKAAPKKATKKKAATKKATAKKGKEKAEAPAKPAKPLKPGQLVVARGKRLSKLGIRWTCWSCGAVFYDLNKPEAICPKCDTDQTAAPKEAKSDEPKKPKRDSLRALRVLDDDDATREDNTPENQSMDLDLEIGAGDKLLDQAEEAAETDED